MNKSHDSPSEADQLHRRAEKRLQEQLTRPGQSPPTAAETLQLVHELQVHQVELELQNHALLEMRTKLEQQVEKYTDLYDFAPLGYFTLMDDGTIEEINLAGATLLGQERTRLIGQRFSLFVSIATQSVFNTFLAETLVGTCRKICEVVLAPKGLPPRFMRLEGLGAVSGAQQQCRIAAIDITERKQAEIVLQQSQVFIKDVLDSLSAHIVVLDHQGFIILANAAWRRFAEQNGGDINCMVGANYLQVCRNALTSHEDADAQAALRGIRTVISGARLSFNLEYPCHSPDQQRWFLMHVFPLTGGHQGVVVAHEDITERKQAEDQLRQYLYMISAMPDAVSLVDKNYIYQIANEEFLRQIGKSREEVIGHSVAEVNGEEKFNKVIKEHLDRSFSGEVTHCQKSFYFTRKGCLFLDVTYAPYYDDQNTITGVVFSARDITKIKAIEDALSRNEAILNEAQEIAKIGSFVWDLRSDSLEWSKSMLNIARMDPGSCYENLNETIMKRLHPDDWASVQQQITTMIEQKRTWPIEFRFIRPDGEIIWLRSSYRFEFDPQNRLIRCIGILHDITESKQMDDALRESEARFRLLLEQTPSIAAQGYSRDGTVHYWNAAAEALYGYTAQEAVGQNILDLIIPPEMRSEAEAAIRQMGITGQALPMSELSLMRKDGSRVAVLSSHAVIQIPNKGVELFCLDLDISERRKMQEKLQVSEANLLALIQNTDDIVVSRDSEGRAIVFNNSFAQTVKKRFGIEANPGIRTTDYLPEAQKAHWQETISKVLEGENYRQEFSWNFGAEMRRYEISLNPIRIGNEVIGFTEFTRDVTERNQAVEALRGREARLQSIFRVTPVGIGLVLDRVILEVNDVFCQITGYARDEIIGKNSRILYPTDQDYEYVGQEKYRQIAQTGTGSVETLWQRKNGAIINVLLNSTPLDACDLTQGVTFSALDITERKKTEDKLSASYEYTRTVLDSLSDAVFVDDANTGQIIDVNQRMCQMYGYSREDALQVDVGQLSSGEEPYSQSDAIEWLRKARTEGPQTFEWIAKTRAGHLFWVEVTVRFVIIKSENRFIVTARDISQRKQTEQTLRQYQYMVSAMSDAVSLVDQNYVYRVVNKEYLRRTGKTGDALVGHSVADIMGEPVFQHLLKEKLDRCLNGETIHFQEWFDIENDRRFLDVIYSPYYDNNSVCSGVMVSSRDITEVKRIEQALQESDERYRQLFNSMINGFALHEMIYDEKGQPCDYRFLEINPAFEQFTGMYAIDLIGRTVRQAIPNIEYHWIETYGRVTLTGEPVHFESHNRVLNKYFEVTAYKPKPGQFACLFTDITERKQVEEALNIALTKYTTLFDSFPLGVTVSDAAGRILESNLMAERLLGISRAAHNRRTIDGAEWQILRPDGSLMPSAEYPSVRALAEHRLVENAEIGIATQQGKTVWLSVTAAPLPIEGYGVVITYNDITEHKQAEEELQRSLKEKEILLREVHHRVKNNLSAIISLLDLRCNLLTDASIISIFAEISSRIKAMALVHEMLYQSDNFSQIDFQDYLESLVRHLRGSFDPHGTIRFNLAATGIWMNIDTAIPCGLIINELVINALKYAFPPDRFNLQSASGDIAITVIRDDNRYTLTVADNGVGLPADLDWRTTRTLGLRLVRMLGQHQLQGTLTLDHTAGTRFTLVSTAIRHRTGGRIMTGKIILIVEDDGLIAAYLQDTLIRLGYTTPEPVATGEAALAAVEAANPDLILMDIQLAGAMDGVTAAEHIRANRDIPVVYLTAFSQDIQLQQAKMTTPYGYLVKPVAERELLATLEMALHKHALDRQLKESEQRLTLALWGADLGMWDWDVRSDAAVYNQRWAEMLGYRLDEIAPNYRSWETRIHPDDLRPTLEVLNAYFENRITFYEIEHRLQHKDGHYVWVLSKGKVIERDPHGNPLRVCGTHLDITQQKQQEEQLRQLAATDPLTGVFNRRYFLNLIEPEISRAQRYARPLTLIMFDIDYFKRVNDDYGHEQGDEVLKTMTARVRQRLRHSDVFVRWGGEEFLILAVETALQPAVALAETLWAALRDAPFPGIGSVTASFGVTEYQPGETLDRWLRRVDDLMYQAKITGRDRICYEETA